MTSPWIRLLALKALGADPTEEARKWMSEDLFICGVSQDHDYREGVDFECRRCGAEMSYPEEWEHDFDADTDERLDRGY